MAIPSRIGAIPMALPVIFSKSNLPAILTQSPAKTAAVGGAIALVGFWLLPFWITVPAIAYGGYQFWKRVR